MQKINNIKDFLLKKKMWVLVVIVMLIIGYFMFGRGPKVNVSILSSTFGTLKETVRATGQVTSLTDLDLSFNKQGVVKYVNVRVGDKVKKGQLLASLSSGSEYASVVQARGALASAKAKLKKTLEGATNEEITLSQVSLDNAKRDLENTKNTQNTLVGNAYSNLLNSTPEATPTGSGSSSPITLSGFYNLNKEGEMNVNVYSTGSGINFSFSGISNGGGVVSTTNPQPLGNTGLYILFSTTTNISGTSYTIALPNKNATDYLTNLNAYESALKTKTASISSAESLVTQREAELAIKKASARTSDVELAEADVLSAEGRLAQAEAVYEENIIRAPAGGTITKVNIKNGELTNAQSVAIVLQDVENLYIEADINESNISNLKLNQAVEVSIDALASDIPFSGFISEIDPSSVSSDGVVNYKIKVALSVQDPNIRPGMNAEITVLIFEKADVLSIPKATIISRDGKNYVNVITNEKKSKYIEREITLGEEGDGSTVEVLTGLNKEEKIAIVEVLK